MTYGISRLEKSIVRANFVNVKIKSASLLSYIGFCGAAPGKERFPLSEDSLANDFQQHANSRATP